MNRQGLVSLVGAGPGDPELITVRGLRCLQRAQVVIYDRLLDPRLLQEAPADAERIFVGKASGQTVLSQREIETAMIARARAGKLVVRLKGGDPFVFGRGGEEVEALAAAGVPYEIVPGVTSAIAAPASAGIPVTHRALASMMTVVTGHEDPHKAQTAVDWDWLARGTGTLVVLMGLERLDAITARLIGAGRDAATPAAVISAGTWPQQRTVVASLATIAGIAEDAGLQSPALLVVGDVVRCAEAATATGLEALAQAI